MRKTIRKTKKAKSHNKREAASTQKEDDQGVVRCKLCDKVFKTNVQLGGHTSRAHKGQSSSYSNKIAIRDARTKIRESLAKAKEIIGSPSAFKNKFQYNKAL